MDSVNVGVIGAGMIGSLHASNLQRHTNGAIVKAVMDVDGERAEVVAADIDARTFEDADALIEDPAVDAVLIASPDFAHANQALACIAAGKPVLCEKPLATSREDAERVLQAELQSGGRLLQVGFMREYDRAHRAVVDLLRGGAIGDLVCFHSLHMNPEKGFENTINSAIVNSLIHDIHSARFMTGAEISSVHVNWTPQTADKPRSARHAIILLRFDNGAIGTLEWSGDSGYGYEVEVDIIGERGKASTAGNTSPVLRQGSVISRAVTPNWPQRFADAYLAEMDAWIGSIRDGVPTGRSAWDGFMAQLVAEACVRSADSGLPQSIHIPPRPQLYQS